MKILHPVIVLLFFVSNKIYAELLENYIFRTTTLPTERFLPILSNGHIGFQIWGNSVFMNGLYNGFQGLSHRARIPNYANIVIDTNHSISKTHTLNVRKGIYQSVFTLENCHIKHTVYAHRFYNRAIINEIQIQRNQNVDEDITFKLYQSPGALSDDIMFKKPRILWLDDELITKQCGHTVVLEDPKYQQKPHRVCLLWTQVPELITLHHNQTILTKRFVMTIDSHFHVAKREMEAVLAKTVNEVLSKHTDEWESFWTSFCIDIEGNNELAKAATSSIFYLTSALPSLSVHQKNNEFFGLSPTGLGRGGKNLNDYEGHSFWDTEIWMFPTILLMNHVWSEILLHYRINRIASAQDNANATGYKGTRFPWESAFTGREVTQPCCPLIAENEIHITADISFALRQFFSVTQNQSWMQQHGCHLALGIAEFWDSRVSYNETFNDYEIRDVMGPDEDHSNVSNNIFTNVAAALSLHFGEFSKCFCENHPNIQTQQRSHYIHSNWSSIANKIRILYDEHFDYHPQYEGYEIGTNIKQADAVLIGYPFLYNMKKTTRSNDLETYEKVTRQSGPAMTWAIHAINWLDIGEIAKAEPHFKRSYQPYLRQPFNVWSEVISGEEGASNFLTGAGGFLQALTFGYIGIRLQLDYMEINCKKLPMNATKMIVNGLKYLEAVFDIVFTDSRAELTFTKCPDDYITIAFNENVRTASKNMTYIITRSKVTLRRYADFFGHC